MHLGRLGWVNVGAAFDPGTPGGTWYDVTVYEFTGTDGTVTNSTMRNRYTDDAMIGPGGDWLRFRLRGPVTGTCTIDEMWAGKVARAVDGLPQNSAVRLTVSSGATGVVLAADEQIFTDPVYLPVNGASEDIVTSFFMPAGDGRALQRADVVGGTGLLVSGNVASQVTSIGAATISTFICDLIQSDAEVAEGLDWFLLTARQPSVGARASYSNVVARHIIVPPEALALQASNTSVRLHLRGKAVGGGNTSITAARVSAVPKAQSSLDVGPDGWVTVLFSASESLTLAEDTVVVSDTVDVTGLGAVGKEALLVSLALNTFQVNVSAAPQGWRGGFLAASSDVETASAFTPFGSLPVLSAVEGFGLTPTAHVEDDYLWGDGVGFVPTGSSTSWDDRTVRQLIKPAVLGTSVGRWVRFRFAGQYTTTPNYDNTINRAAVSTVPTAQTNFDVGASGWVPITFAGATFGAAPTYTGAWSDPVFLADFGDASHEALVVSFHVRGDRQPHANNITGWTTAYRNGGDSVVSADSFTTNTRRVALIGVQTGLAGPEGDALAASIRRSVVIQFAGARADNVRRYVVMEDV